MFSKILIANRGEIAVRLILACRELGITSAVIYSEPDARMPWVRMADESYPLRGSTAAETYLNQEAIFEIAKQSKAAAIHPGYGFLSENAQFAAACAGHGLVFIGPSPDVIRLMGSKAEAREFAKRCGVPVVPGYDTAGMTDKAIAAAAVDQIGFPLLVKASAGGGGKGMRVVDDRSALDDALRDARRESLSAFGDNHLLIERYLGESHHVEIQVLGDQHGRLLHLYERDCSIQRRHQKIIEESPATILTPEQRAQMAAAAMRLATAAGYENAGTVEFIVDAAGEFFFLEMNTRLQVEHPVTELTCGLDLAVWQIRVAAGDALPFAQTEIQQRGHALECRVYAEDPANDFMPSTGRIEAYAAPIGPGVRVDSGVQGGSEITPYYDPMIAKVITWGQDRAEAVRKMQRALGDMVALGVTTNIPYLLAILSHPVFLSGEATTRFLERDMGSWQAQESPDLDVLLAAAAFEALAGGVRRPASLAANGGQADDGSDPWNSLPSWRNVAAPPEN